MKQIRFIGIILNYFLKNEYINVEGRNFIVYIVIIFEWGLVKNLVVNIYYYNRVDRYKEKLC